MDAASDTSTRGPWALALGLAGLALAVRGAQVLRGFTFRFTSEDQTLYWYAVREFAHGRVHEPYFFGQNYTPMLEALPAAPLSWLGLAPQLTVPVISLLSGLLPWAVLAARAWRRGQPGVAWLTLALPLALPVAYPMLLSLASYNCGVALGGLAVVLLEAPGSLARAFAGGLLAGLAYLANPNAALLVAPAVLRAALLAGRRWPPTAALVLGGELGLFLKRLADRFYVAHPNWALHRAWSIAFDRKLLAEGLAGLSDHWGDLAPAGLPAWAYVLLLGGAALGLARRGRAASALAVLAGLLLAALSLGVTKVHNGEPTVFFSYARMYLGLPLLLAWALQLLAEAWPWRPGRGLALGAALLTAGGGLGLAARAGAEIEAVAARRAVLVHVMPVAEVLADCARLTALADASGARWVLHKDNRTLAYACTALTDSRVDFLIPGYERRTWLLERAEKEKVGQVLAAEFTAEVCTRPTKPAWSACEVRDAPLGAVQVSSAPARSVLDFARGLALRLRRF